MDATSARWVSSSPEKRSDFLTIAEISMNGLFPVQMPDTLPQERGENKTV
jgi:hypothetical protein